MIIFVKRFIAWFSLKPKLDSSVHVPPFFNEREVWWCSVGENVGSEVSGKGEYFRRPVLVLRKLDSFSFIGIPFTTQAKTGTWYANLKIKGKDNNAILSQIRHVDYRRMDKILCSLDHKDFEKIRIKMIDLLSGN
ncbi:MAG: type II toxin-antitoxin system PemK/MazF family toxin [Patescibacteria group bacterium]